MATDAYEQFIVVWDSNGSSGTDADNRSIQGQRYGEPPMRLKLLQFGVE